MPQRVQSGSNDHESTMEPPRKRGMIFKNAFGASDVEEDGDEDDEGDDEPGSRSVSKGKKKVPSNGVGINPADGQPGGFELVDKDGDSMRRKIRIEYITDKSRRHITFSKRKAGIMKKVGLAVWAERRGMCVANRTKRVSLFIGVRIVDSHRDSGLAFGCQRDWSRLYIYDGKAAAACHQIRGEKSDPGASSSRSDTLSTWLNLGFVYVQACLNAPGADDEEHSGPSASTSNTQTKKERPLAIRPLKLNAEETVKLAASAASAIPVPPIPEDTTPRPRKRLPSGKNRRPSKKEQQALKDAQTDGTGNPLSEGNHPTSESDTQTVEVPDHLHMGHHMSSAASGQDMQAVQQQQHSHQQGLPQQPLQHQPQGAQQPAQHNGHHMHMQTTPVSATFSTHSSLGQGSYHMSPGRAQINHQAGYYQAQHHNQPMMNMQPNFSYPTPPTHAPPQYLSGVHHGMGVSQGFDPNHFADSNPFVSHSNGMAM